MKPVPPGTFVLGLILVLIAALMVMGAIRDCSGRPHIVIHKVR